MGQSQSRFRRVRQALVLGLAAIFFTTAAGCFGKFRAMNAVYDFNRTATSNGIVRSLLFFAMTFIIPAYEVAFLIDWIVLNTLDFFNGTNQVAVKDLPDGSKVEMAKVDADTVRVRKVDPAGKETSFDIVRVGADAGYLRTSDGKIVGSVQRLSDGSLYQQAH